VEAVSHATPTTLATADVTLPAGHLLRRLPLVGGVAGLLGLGASAGLYAGDPTRFYQAYLVAFLFFLSLALGGLVYVLIMRAARAGSSASVRRLGEALMATLPLFAVLFVPLLFGLHHLYEWTHAEVVARDALLTHKRAYLNVPFFVVRAAVYFLCWGGLAWWFYRRSVAQDASGDHAITRRLQVAAPPALVAFGVTITFAAFDWIMSLQPHWYSTILGPYFFSGSLVGAFAVMALLAVWLRGHGRLGAVITPDHLHDLGKWLFAFTAFWAYLAFSQYLLIWYANIPEETIFFARRWAAGYQALTLALVLGHFAVPFFFLLPRSIKRRPGTLAVAAVWMLLAHLVDLYWLVMPAAEHGHFGVRLVDLTTLLGLGGLFVAFLAWLLGRHAVVAVGDPRLPEALAFENE
jgi:hypothetical protein